MEHSAPADVIAGVHNENVRKLSRFEGRSLTSRAFGGIGRLSVHSSDKRIRVTFGDENSLIIQFVVSVASDGFTAMAKGNEYTFKVVNLAFRKPRRVAHSAIKGSEI
jgi:hypothetical protein